ncbi:hypothetical protein, partial [Ferroplasma sp.]|uniref:hypothetical protein n=1 Tax=Ferroplasma sp. TaxID=2591003 RepID=UPI00307D6E6C
NLDKEELNLFIKSIFRKNVMAVIINAKTEVTAIGLDGKIDRLIDGLSDRGIKLEAILKNKKLFTARCIPEINEKLIKEVLVFSR